MPPTHIADKDLALAVRAALAATENSILSTEDPEDAALEFARSVVAGLETSPRVLDCRFLYDERGSALYDQICAQPEYYPTRTEDALLARHADALPPLTGAVTIVELGSGSSAKTRRLLSAYLARQALVGYVPVDVSESALRGAVARIGESLPEARVVGVQGTYDRAFEILRAIERPLLVFLGSTIGNLFEPQAEAFWRRVGERLPVGGFVLLGVDLVKDAETLDRAYDDEAGATRAFTLNLFARMNRELDARLDLDAIHHRARWIRERQRVEIHAEFSTAQRLHVAPLSRSFEIARGERILVEISAKFEVPSLTKALARHGLEVRGVWSDERRWFATLLLSRAPAGVTDGERA